MAIISLRILWLLGGATLVSGHNYTVPPGGPSYELKNITVGVGEAVKLGCHIDFPNDFPISHTVTWSKEENVIYCREKCEKRIDPEYEGRIEPIIGEKEFGDGTLLLTNVMKKDEGKYTCQIRFLNRDPSKRNDGVIYYLTVDISDIPQSTETSPPATAEAEESNDGSTESLKTSAGPPRDVKVLLTDEGYLVSWSPPEYGKENVRVYIVRVLMSPRDNLMQRYESNNTHYLINLPEDGKKYYVQVSSLSNNDEDVIGKTVLVEVPAYGRIKIAVASVGCLMLMILLGAVLWYAKTKREEAKMAADKEPEKAAMQKQP